MASSVHIAITAIVANGERQFPIGTGSLPLTIALTAPGGIDNRNFDVANGTTATLWDVAASPAGSFLFLAILSDKALLLEFQGTAVADNFHLTLYPGLPLILGSDDTLRYNAASYTGVADLFKKILGKNSSGATATVQVLVCE